MNFQSSLEQVKKMAELGFMGMMVDPKYGGSGLDSVSYVLAITEISKIDASTAVIMSVNNSLVCAGIEKYANEEQKMKYLVPLAKGEVMVLLPVRARGRFRCYFSKLLLLIKETIIC
jgi:alkylation response protein AidB-like acyl-CoA dehydrogenase